MVYDRRTDQLTALVRVTPLKRVMPISERIAALEALGIEFSEEDNSDGVGFCEIEVALAYFEMEQYDVGLDVLNKAMELPVSNNVLGEMRFNRGSVYAMGGRREEARTDYEAVKSLAPQLAELADVAIQALDAPYSGRGPVIRFG